MKHLFALALVLVFAVAGFARADEEARSPGQIKNNPIIIEGGTSPRMTVVFSHKSHRDKGFACITCHHESSAAIPYSSCREDCHATPGAQERDPMSMFMAFHAKGTDRSCYGCHSMLAEKAPKAYPAFYGCRPCHDSQKRLSNAALVGK